jgi:hypothetical protein
MDPVDADVVMQYTRIVLQQSETVAMTVHTLVLFLERTLRQLFPEAPPAVKMYGSIHHGLYVAGHSKINLDVGGAGHPQTLQILTSALQTQAACPSLTWPTLMWHRSVQRPAILMFFWDGVVVNVTANNKRGLAISEFIKGTLDAVPRAYLRLTFLLWKQRLRSETNLLGPNRGQVSVYALLAVLLPHLPTLKLLKRFADFEQSARLFVCNHLLLLPESLSTWDPMGDGHDLTRGAFLAPMLAKFLLYGLESERGPQHAFAGAGGPAGPAAALAAPVGAPEKPTGPAPLSGVEAGVLPYPGVLGPPLVALRLPALPGLCEPDPKRSLGAVLARAGAD